MVGILKDRAINKYWIIQKDKKAKIIKINKINKINSLNGKTSDKLKLNFTSIKHYKQTNLWTKSWSWNIEENVLSFIRLKKWFYGEEDIIKPKEKFDSIIN